MESIDKWQEIFLIEQGGGEGKEGRVRDEKEKGICEGRWIKT